MPANSQFAMAVHILTLLARSGGENLKSDCIAQSVNTNPVVIRRLLAHLAQAGLVASQTGAAGGTHLAKQPKDVSLACVYKAVSCGDVFALPHREARKDCPVGRNIQAVLCRLQKEVDCTVNDKLREFTLEDVIQMIEGSKAGG